MGICLSKEQAKQAKQEEQELRMKQIIQVQADQHFVVLLRSAGILSGEGTVPSGQPTTALLESLSLFVSNEKKYEALLVNNIADATTGKAMVSYVESIRIMKTELDKFMNISKQVGISFNESDRNSLTSWESTTQENFTTLCDKSILKMGAKMCALLTQTQN